MKTILDGTQLETELNHEKQLVISKAASGSIVVKTQDDYLIATDEINQHKKLRLRMVDYWKKLKDAANKVHKDICTKEKNMVSPIDERIKALGDGCREYLLEQDRLLKEAQRKADEEARRKEAEVHEQILAESEKAALAGNIQDAEDFADQIQDVKVEAEQVKDTTPMKLRTANGLSSWAPDIEVTHYDVMAVIGAVLTGEFPLSCVQINDKELKGDFIKKGIKEYNANGVLVKPTFKNTSR